MLVRGLRIRLLRELSRTLQGWSDVVQQQLDKAADAAPDPVQPAADRWPLATGPADPAEAAAPQDAATDAVPDAPPAHWLARARSAGPPAHWQQRVAQAGSALPSAPVPTESASAPADTVPVARPGPAPDEPERVEGAPPHKQVATVSSQRLGINRTTFTRVAIKFAEQAEHTLSRGRGSPPRSDVRAVENRTIFAGAVMKFAEKVEYRLFHGRVSPPRPNVGAMPSPGLEINRTIFTAEHKEDPEGIAKKLSASPTATDRAPTRKSAQQDARVQPQLSHPSKPRAGLHQPLRPTSKPKRGTLAAGDVPLPAERQTTLESQASLENTGWDQPIRLRLPRVSQPPARKNPVPVKKDPVPAGRKIAEGTKPATDQVARIAHRPPLQFVLQDALTPARFGTPGSSAQQAASIAAKEDAPLRQAPVQPTPSQFVRASDPSYGWDQVHAEYPQPETTWPVLPPAPSLAAPVPGFGQGELQPDSEDAAEDWAAILRRWDRQRRLDEEQRRL